MDPEKRKSIRQEYFTKGTVVFVVVAACLLFAFVVFNYALVWRHVSKVLNVLKPIFYGIVIAYLVNPIVNFSDALFCKKTAKKEISKVLHIVSVILALLIFILLIALCFYLIIPQFVSCIGDLIDKLPAQAKNMTERVMHTLRSKSSFSNFTNHLFQTSEKWVTDQLIPRLSKWVTGFTWANDVANGIGAILDFVKNFLIGLVCALYLLIRKDSFLCQSRKLTFAIFKKNTAENVLKVAKKSHEIFSGFINGKLLDSLIIGLLCFVGVTVLRIPYTMLISVVVGITNVIPVFGPYIGGVPCFVLVFLSNPVKGITFGIFVILLQALDGNFIGPKILGDKTGIETFWVVFSITVGGGLFGVFGMLIGVPTFAVFYYLLSGLTNHRLRKKELPLESEFYEKNIVDKLNPLPEEIAESETQPVVAVKGE